MSPRIVLVGPPGSGKSAVAAAIAARAGTPVIDTDERLAAAHGTTTADLYLDLGEAEFHRVEAPVAADAVRDAGVVALGSGAVPAVAEALQAFRADGGTVVLLDVSLAAGMPRVGLNAPRSVALGSPRSQYSTMAAERRPIYLAVADHVLDTSAMTVAEVAERVLALVGDAPDGPRRAAGVS